MSDWSEYYVDRIGNAYTKYCNRRYAEFINAILSKIPKTGFLHNLKEEGCGIATISKLLVSMYLPDAKFHCSDLDVAQCINAKENVKGFQNVSVIVDNILKQSVGITQRYDMIFGHGVLEHFDYNDIKKILSRQRKEAKYVIHYVPTDGYDEPSFGDERLLPVDWWVTNFEPTEHIVFNEGKDLVLIWEE